MKDVNCLKEWSQELTENLVLPTIFAATNILQDVALWTRNLTPLSSLYIHKWTGAGLRANLI